MKNKEIFIQTIKISCNISDHIKSLLAYILVILALLFFDQIIDTKNEFKDFDIFSTVLKTYTLFIISFVLSGVIGSILSGLLMHSKLKNIAYFIIDVLEKYITIIKTGLGIIFIYGLIIKYQILWLPFILFCVTTFIISFLTVIRKKE